MTVLRDRSASVILLLFSFALLPFDGHAQISTTVWPNPAAAKVPLTINETFCGGPKILQISFYYSTNDQDPLQNLIGTVTKQPGQYASIEWTPAAPATYYLEATSSNTTDCPANSGLITQVVGEAPTYFGFYDSNSVDFPDETATTSTFANTVWIECTTPAGCSTALQEAQKYNMHAILSLDLVSPGLLAPGYTATQLQAWEANWNTFWGSYYSVFAPYVTNGTIAAFYPYDEPFKKPYPLEWTSGNQAIEATDQLEYVGNVIHGSVPNVKGFSGSEVATTLTGADTFTFFTHGENIIPSNFDWIGIDIYECWASCADDAGVLHETYSWYVSTLEANLSSGQRVMLLPASAIYYGNTYQYWQANEPAGQWQSEVNSNSQIVQEVLNLGITDTHVIGEFGFLYQTYSLTNPNAVWIGTSDPSMTTMRNVLTKFGTDIMNR